MRYPLGIQDFRRLRQDGYVYVDKTRQIIGMLDAGAALFLSRPRRFGKSLTVSTLAELYGGPEARPLFEGLWAYEHWDFAAMERPVIWLRFNDLGYEQGVHVALARELHRIGNHMGIPLDDVAEEPSQLLRELVSRAAAAHPSGRCAVLFDEYDKPIVDHLHDLPQAERHRRALKAFYGVLKGASAELEKVFLTGVSAFSKVSIFSDLNHVVNLTLDPAARTVTGITGGELETYLGAAVEATGVPREQIRTWYNGYSWGGGDEERVYNPWSLLSFLRTGQVNNQWIETGNPTWLIGLAREQHLYDLAPVQSSAQEMLSFRLEALDLPGVLFQTGYLTVAPGGAPQPYSTNYVLDYPNEEVRRSLLGELFADYLGRRGPAPSIRGEDLAQAFANDELDTVFVIFAAVFADLPYDVWARDVEWAYHLVVHLTFSLLGVRVRSEVHTSRGRCDALVETDTHVYALEFERGAGEGAVAEALRQIADRGYLDPYAASAKTRVAIGVAFDAERRAVGAWRAEQIPETS